MSNVYPGEGLNGRMVAPAPHPAWQRFQSVLPCPSPTSDPAGSLLRYPIASLFRSQAKTRPPLFNNLHTLFNSQFRVSLFFSSHCALFAKNTRGGGSLSHQSLEFSATCNSLRIYLFQTCTLQLL